MRPVDGVKPWPLLGTGVDSSGHADLSSPGVTFHPGVTTRSKCSRVNGESGWPRRVEVLRESCNILSRQCSNTRYSCVVVVVVDPSPDSLSHRSLRLCSTSFTSSSSSSSWSLLRHPISVVFLSSSANFPFLTHWRMAGNGVPVLLVTANVGSIFEEVSSQDSFLTSLNDRSTVPRDLPFERGTTFFFLSFFLSFLLFLFSSPVQSQLARISYDNAMPILVRSSQATLPSFITFSPFVFLAPVQCNASRFCPRSRNVS